MQFHKKKISYAIWLVYCVIVWAFSAIGIMYICMERTMADVSIMITLIFSLVMISSSFFIIRFITGRYFDYIYLNQKKSQIVEIVCAVVLAIGGLGYRIHLVLDKLVVNPTFTYYDYAKIGATVHTPDNISAIESLYIHFLSMIFTFLGNKMLVGFFIQIILFMIATCFMYAGIRTICGKTPALIMLVYLMFSHSTVRASVNCVPDMILYFGFSVCVWGISIYYKLRSENEIYHIGELSCVILPAFLTGVLIFFDIGNLVLLLLFVFAYKVVIREEASDIPSFAGKFYIQFLTALGTALIGFFCCLSLYCLLGGSFSIDTLLTWFSYNSDFAFHNAFYKMSISDMIVRNPFVSVSIFVFMIWNCFSFFLCAKEDRLSIWSVILSVSFVLGFSGVSYMGFLHTMIFIFILAGNGFSGLAYGLDDLADVSLESAPLEEMQQEVEREEQEKEDSKPTYNTTLINYIPNPLPTPKPHVKKTMDYAFIPKDSEMKYDIQVYDGDDFDI